MNCYCALRSRLHYPSVSYQSRPNGRYQRGLTPAEAAQRILYMDRSLPMNLYGETTNNDALISGVIDSAAFADVGLGSESGRGGRAKIMNSLGTRWTPSPKGWIAHCGRLSYPSAIGPQTRWQSRPGRVSQLSQSHQDVARDGVRPKEPRRYRSRVRRACSQSVDVRADAAQVRIQTRASALRVLIAIPQPTAWQHI
jgi:hypothetical protein